MDKMAGKKRFHSGIQRLFTELQSVNFCHKVVKRVLSRAKAKNGTGTKKTSEWQIMLKRYNSVYTEGTDCKAYIFDNEILRRRLRCYGMLNYVSEFVGNLCRFNIIGRGERESVRRVVFFFHSVHALIV